MWKLTRWIAIAGLVWTAGYSYNRHFDPEVQWIKSIYQEKLERIAQVQVPKRVLVIGGSGTHFGIDALLIEQELGIPVLNLGLHAGLGLNAILASLEGEIGEGDVVLLIPEYGLLENDGTGDFSSGFAGAIGRPGLGGFGPEQTAKEIMISGVPGSDRTVQFLKLLVRSSQNKQDTEKLNASYTNKGLDERGTPQVLPSGKPSPQTIRTQISNESLRRLQIFQDEVEMSGAQLVIGLPWILSTGDDPSRQTVHTIIDTLNEISPVIYADDLSLKTDPTLFGDTHYHLSSRGRYLRSQQLAQQLKPLLSAQSSFRNLSMASSLSGKRALSKSSHTK